MRSGKYSTPDTAIGSDVHAKLEERWEERTRSGASLALASPNRRSLDQKIPGSIDYIQNIFYLPLLSFCNTICPLHPWHAPENAPARHTHQTRLPPPSASRHPISLRLLPMASMAQQRRPRPLRSPSSAQHRSRLLLNRPRGTGRM